MPQNVGLFAFLALVFATCRETLASQTLPIATTLRSSARILSGAFSPFLSISQRRERICDVTQPRMSQILNLNLLYPSIQEQLLFLPPHASGRQAIHERKLRAICSQTDWSVQRREFYQFQLDGRKIPSTSSEH